MLVRAVTAELRTMCDLKVITLNGASNFMSETGAAEAHLRSVFAAARAHIEGRSGAASLIFIDEIDGLCPSRATATSMEARIVAQMLTLLDGMGSRGQVVVVAATNRPNSIDAGELIDLSY